MIRFIFALLLTILPVASHADRGVLGAKSYDSPIGCAPDSVFNLVAGSVLNTYATTSAPTSGHSFNILPYYNNEQGASFQLLIDTPTSSLVMASSGLSPMSYFGSLVFSTGGNPDNNGTYGTISEYGTSRVFLHGQQQVAPCASPPCLHHYMFSTSGGGPGIDINLAFPAANSSQGTFGGISDGSSFYFLQRLTTPANTTMLWKFDISGTSTEGFLNVGNVANRTEFVQDSTFLFFTDSNGNRIQRVEKLGLGSSTFFPITPTFLQDPLAYSPGQSAFYLATSVPGTLTIRRYTADFSANTHNLVIANELISPGGLMMDEQAGKLYLVTEPLATTVKRVRRLNPSTLTSEQTLSINLGTNGFVAAPDFTHKYLWISDIGNPSHIQRVQLCT